MKPELSKYIKRLCETGREKSLLGDEADAAVYFVKAIEVAKDSADFICISSEIYKADMQENKYFAYFCLLEALQRSENPVKKFKKMLYSPELIPMISEFLLKMPDHMYHFLLSKAKNEDETKTIANFFSPLAHLISDPDPLEILNKNLRKAS